MSSVQLLSSSFGRAWLIDAVGLMLVIVLQLVWVAVVLAASYTHVRDTQRRTLHRPHVCVVQRTSAAAVAAAASISNKKYDTGVPHITIFVLRLL